MIMMTDKITHNGRTEEDEEEEWSELRKTKAILIQGFNLSLSLSDPDDVMFHHHPVFFPPPFPQGVGGRR